MSYVQVHVNKETLYIHASAHYVCCTYYAYIYLSMQLAYLIGLARCARSLPEGFFSTRMYVSYSTPLQSIYILFIEQSHIYQDSSEIHLFPPIINSKRKCVHLLSPLKEQRMWKLFSSKSMARRVRKLCSTIKSSTKQSSIGVITGTSTGGLGAQTAIELAAAYPKAAE